MSIREKAGHIWIELKGHAPFTLFGAVLGIGFMLLFHGIGQGGSRILFSIFHPTHVLLSAMVTASMFALHRSRKGLILMILVGYFGSIGIATLSDTLIPHIGTKLFGLDMPAHGEVFHGDEHQHEAALDEQMPEHGDGEHAHRFKIHLGFIEEWYIVNPAAFAGIFIAFFLPRTKFPHAFHVLISTWASSSYLLMSSESGFTFWVALAAFTTLFLATWIPCCVSDIVFPLLFVKSDVQMNGACRLHSHHSHPHEHNPQGQA